MKFEIGKSIEDGKSVTMDIDTLIRTRLLVQANSGGGKSYLLRRILEQTHGKVQQIVIDLEGEFSTLGEKYDYVIVGKGTGVSTDVRYAPMLAEKLLEMNASAIIDLYELKHYDRIRFVKLFIDAMMNVRKELWHPCLVVIDEAHVFAPEKSESEALQSVIDICTRGRKRSFCAILATQRLSKLHKDAAAECNNKLIGRTGLDVDRKRASEELGFTTKEDTLNLRQMLPGEFFVFGPACTQVVTKVKVGSVSTTHPEVGSKSIVAPPAPTEKVKAMLAKLADLPKEAEQKARTIEDAQKKIRELERELRSKPQPAPQPKPTKEQIEKEAARLAKPYQDAMLLAKGTVVGIVKSLRQEADTLDKMKWPEKNVILDAPQYRVTQLAPRTPHVPTQRFVPKERPPVASNGEAKIGLGARRMLRVLIQYHPNDVPEGQMRALAGLKKSGTFSNYKSQLRIAGLVEESGGKFRATDLAIQEYGHEADSAPSTTEEVVNIWGNRLGAGARRMLQVLVDARGEFVTEESLLDATGMNKSGTWSNYKSQLRTANLIVTEGNMIAARKESLFL